MKGLYGMLEDLVWLTQLGLSMLLPPVACLWLAYWLVNGRGWPMWIYLPALLLGLACGAQSFWQFARRMLKRAKKQTEEKPSAAFNKHS